MPDIEYTPAANRLLASSQQLSTEQHKEFLTPLFLLHALLCDPPFRNTVELYADAGRMLELVEQHEEEEPQKSDDEQKDDLGPELSILFCRLLQSACDAVVSSNNHKIDVPHLVNAMLRQEDSWAATILRDALKKNDADFLSDLIMAYADGLHPDEPQHTAGGEEAAGEEGADHASWKQLVTCINDTLDSHNPLIGREKELERTIQVLCRKEKNNALHVGEPGVGKTALVYGLTRRIAEGRVPKKLQGCKVYQLDLGTLLAGTQFRGDFEKRIKHIMDGIRQQGKAIVYIDEIHNLVGAGQTGEGSMDASNMLKPYLEQGDIRFIGSTTYEEYNRYFARSKGIVRRFQQIDIDEPSPEEAIDILKGLRTDYEQCHGVVYEDVALEHAVRQSHKYITERFLPDKAIDLIDEAGAAAEMHQDSPGDSPTLQPAHIIGKKQIDDVLQKVCKIDANALKDDDNHLLETLRERIAARIYGQDEAVAKVVEAVQMSKAGLLDDNKPLASLLFVGPTGVGKTEVARVLAQELGIQLQRFDMSEYTEKHTVAKLIGSPAGYVGYDDGGLLTDAIRKTPNCVLLLDEIEKAHQDIYNILLQVMDYAVLTDNKGRKADFRNVVLIMTSNAGAQYAGQAIGFEPLGSRGEAMMRQVKKTFKPEFINRLSATVVFHDMDLTMAGLILDKKLRELQQKLAARNVGMTLTEPARELLLKKGFTREYGAREMDRVISQMLKPLLMREILFGTLKDGGSITVTPEMLE